MLGETQVFSRCPLSGHHIVWSPVAARTVGVSPTTKLSWHLPPTEVCRLHEDCNPQSQSGAVSETRVSFNYYNWVAVKLMSPSFIVTETFDHLGDHLFHLCSRKLAKMPKIVLKFQPFLLRIYRNGHQYTQWTIKERDILFLTITLENLDRFLQFLYHFNREEILHTTVVKFTISP